MNFPVYRKHKRCDLLQKDVKNVGFFFFSSFLFSFRAFFSNKGIFQSTGVCFYFHKHFGIGLQTSPDNNLGVSTTNFPSSFRE